MKDMIMEKATCKSKVSELFLVNHKILLRKLEKYGIRGLPLEWFHSYLSDRAQFVQIGNVKSNVLTMKCGVPQGSTLGPLLFLIYINDLPNSSDLLQFRILADDTNLFYSSKTPNALQNTINEELKKFISTVHQISSQLI
jgi:hypothetical protein